MMQSTPQIHLAVVPQRSRLESDHLLDFQLLVISLLRPENLMIDETPFFRRIQPNALQELKLPADFDFSKGVLIFGSAPIWLYGALVDRVRQCPWIATFDLRLHCGIVIQSSISDVNVGDCIGLEQSETAGIAIALGGPPNSGKSMLANALRLALMDQGLKVYLHRANWDGQGNWAYEMNDTKIVQELVEQGKYRIHHLPNADQVLNSYFEYHAKAIENMRSLMDIVLVDIGGVPDTVKLPIIQACSHSMIISRSPNETFHWTTLMNPYLKPLITIHSVLQPCCEVLQKEPLEIRAGAWTRDTDIILPKIILDMVLDAFH